MFTKNVISSPVTMESIDSNICHLRDQRVMLSFDLAKLYQVETKVLIQAVKRNIERFPENFMFQLNKSEYENLKSQIVTSSWGGVRRALPYAFTQEGVAMLSGILHSNRAVEVNIAIMRAFVRLRQLILSHDGLSKKLNVLEEKLIQHDKNFVIVFTAIRKLMDMETKPKRQFGFRT